MSVNSKTEVRKVVMTKSMKIIPEELTLAQNFMFKELLEIFHKTESTKCKILEADPDVERVSHGSREAAHPVLGAVGEESRPCLNDS